MDKLTTDFLSFFLPYMGFIILSSLGWRGNKRKE